MKKALLLLTFLTLIGCGERDQASPVNDIAYSDIKTDEHIVFFRTAGWLDEANKEWNLPVHGWIYEPEDSSARKALLEEVLEEQFDLVASDATEANLSRRLNLLVADNERGKTIVVNIAGRHHALPPSAENGHFKDTLVIPVAEAGEFANDGFIRFTAVTRESDSRSFSGEIRLTGPRGLSVISDIDDTVKITNVVDKKSLLEHTFLLDFAAAPGMAQVYERWSEDDVSFHYVSSSPWQLYTPLSEFLDAKGFPWSTFNLKAVRFRDETFFDLFKKGTETKPATIEAILATYTDRDFVLVGDSGEQDPEVYAALIREHPQQIQRVFIRNVTEETPDNERFTAVFDGVDPDLWQLFDDPRSLSLPVTH